MTDQALRRAQHELDPGQAFGLDLRRGKYQPIRDGIKLAAYLGHAGAQAHLGWDGSISVAEMVDRDPDIATWAVVLAKNLDYVDWAKGLEKFGRNVQIRAALAVAEARLNAWDPPFYSVKNAYRATYARCTQWLRVNIQNGCTEWLFYSHKDPRTEGRVVTVGRSFAEASPVRFCIDHHAIIGGYENLGRPETKRAIFDALVPWALGEQ